VKVCTKCKVEKDGEEFTSHKGHKDGLDSWCRECHAEHARFRRTSAPGQKEKTYGDSIRRKFGITLNEYDRILKEQNGACAICKRVNPNGWRLAVDHDHKTGKIRGLLCTRCNTALGTIEDSPERVFSLLAYLEKYKIKPRPPIRKMR
jgi:hypothetical protein